MKIFEIRQEKQENGLWGTPFNCFKIDKLAPFNDRKWKLRSAAIALLDQKWGVPFEIFGSTDSGFGIRIPSLEGGKMFGIQYDKYEVVDNILYEFENEQEHTIFLRKNKIKELNELYCSLEE